METESVSDVSQTNKSRLGTGVFKKGVTKGAAEMDSKWWEPEN